VLAHDLADEGDLALLTREIQSQHAVQADLLSRDEARAAHVFGEQQPQRCGGLYATPRLRCSEPYTSIAGVRVHQQGMPAAMIDLEGHAKRSGLNDTLHASADQRRRDLICHSGKRQRVMVHGDAPCDVFVTYAMAFASAAAS